MFDICKGLHSVFGPLYDMAVLGKKKHGTMLLMIPKDFKELQDAEYF